ncbi:uncharacterized protein [Melanerpes formicivorus]|uniref:uncharacterized protein n=1 Tax=Melanerpes formicivorus TaxID=211600 RepID=UPI00358F8484
MGQLNCCHRSRLEPCPEQQCPADTHQPEPLLRQPVRLSRGRKRQTRELLLFAGSLVIAKAKRGGVLRSLLGLALGRLMVLSGGEPSETAEGEEDSSTKFLVLIWPSGSCVILFGSRAVKELWVSTLRGQRPPEGAEGAQVTQLPSLKLLLKELSRQRAPLTLHSERLERLLAAQAKVGTEQQLPPVPTGGKGEPGRLDAGGRRRRRLGLPWPFSRRQSSAASAGAPRPSGCGGSAPLFGQPSAAVCSRDGRLPQPVQVPQPVEFLSDHQGEAFEEEQVTRLEAAEAEEVAAAGPGVEAGEVLPEAPASQEPKSSPEHRRLPKASGDMQHCSCRKRKLSCREERDSQPDNKRHKLERDPQGSLKRSLQKCHVAFAPVYLSSVWDLLLSSE